MESLFDILFFGGLFFLMMRFGCGAHMFGHGHRKGKNENNQARKNVDGRLEQNLDRESPPRTDIDPVCGKSVLTDSAKTSLYGGMVYFFCTTECREVFEVDPVKHIEKNNGKKRLILEQPPAKDNSHA